MKKYLCIFCLTICFFVERAQINISSICGIYDVKITETSCTSTTNYQTGLLYINSAPSSSCACTKDSSYTTGYWFNSSICLYVLASDSSFKGCSSVNLASGKYFSNDSIHLFIYYYFGTQCAHEYFGKRKSFTGINDLTLLNSLITISPQPANEELAIHFPKDLIKCSPLLYDIKGEKMNLCFLKSEEKMYISNTSALSPGIYFLHLETTAGTIRRKVIVCN